MKNNKLSFALLLILSLSLLLSSCNSTKEIEQPENIEVSQTESDIIEEAKSPVPVPDESPLGTGPNESPEETHPVESHITVEPAEELAGELTVKPAEDPKSTGIKVSEAEENALKIEGKVRNEFFYTLDKLKAMTDIIFEGNYYSINSFGTAKHNTFKGVNLWCFLETKAYILDDATTISIIATDGYQMDFTVDQVKKQDYIDETNPDVKLPMIIAWEQDGDEYSIDEGSPFKLIVGQTEAGDVNKPQWVSNIDKIIVE